MSKFELICKYGALYLQYQIAKPKLSQEAIINMEALFRQLFSIIDDNE